MKNLKLFGIVLLVLVAAKQSFAGEFVVSISSVTGAANNQLGCDSVMASFCDASVSTFQAYLVYIGKYDRKIIGKLANQKYKSLEQVAFVSCEATCEVSDITKN